jgi:hypothetical protein
LQGLAQLGKSSFAAQNGLKTIEANSQARVKDRASSYFAGHSSNNKVKAPGQGEGQAFGGSSEGAPGS